MTAREQIKEAYQVELHVVNNVLAPIGLSKEDSFTMPAPYDRKKADEESNTEMQTVYKGKVGPDGKTPISAAKGEIAATARLIHEANRFRRDYNIATASHKQLMLGTYRTLYQRKLKLEDALK